MPGSKQRAAAAAAAAAATAAASGRARSRSRSNRVDRRVGPAQRASSAPVGRVHSAASGSQDAPGATTNEQDAEDAKSFRRHVASLYLRNKFSGEQMVRLVEKADRAGAQGVKDLASSRTKHSTYKNANRGLMRSLAKESKCVEPYYAEIQVAAALGSPQSKMVLLPFLLLHEMFANILETIDQKAVVQFESDVGLESKRERFAAENKVPLEFLVPVGFHGDGVPHQKSRTVEVFSWNFAAQPMWERFLFTCIEKAHLCNCGCKGDHTLHGILKVFIWSLNILLVGLWPNERHDATPWNKSDQN
jgi:hypothetical protein